MLDESTSSESEKRPATSKSRSDEKAPGGAGLGATGRLGDKKTPLFEMDYAPAPEARSIVNIKPSNDLFIGGKFVASEKGEKFDTVNPATEEKLAELTEATSEDVDLAVAAARRAYEKTWSKLPGAERGRYLFRIARIIQERAREFAVLESLDNGKPIKESRDADIPLAAAHFFYYAGWADKLQYAVPGGTPRALGVAAQIIPWNFPLLMAAWKIAPALATGNCVVLKPAEQTSLTALLLAEVCQQAGLPDGVVNIITGAGKTGAALVAHPHVDKVAFTGSTEIGRLIARSVAGTAKKLTLELGGKSANIVFEDAALDQAVEGVVDGIYFNQGHVCCAGSRLLLEESVADVFLDKLRTRMAAIRVGDPLDKNTDLGAINSKQEYDKIRSVVDAARSRGLEHFEASATALPEKGYFIKPTFFNHVAPSDHVYRREIFGPVLAVSTFRTPAEAVERANDSAYGLAAGLWSEKASKIQNVAGALKAGVVWGNAYNLFDPSSPFGGYFESGWGREGGLQGLFPYLEMR